MKKNQINKADFKFDIFIGDLCVYGRNFRNNPTIDIQIPSSGCFGDPEAYCTSTSSITLDLNSTLELIEQLSAKIVEYKNKTLLNGNEDKK